MVSSVAVNARVLVRGCGRERVLITVIVKTAAALTAEPQQANQGVVVCDLLNDCRCTFFVSSARARATGRKTLNDRRRVIKRNYATHNSATTTTTSGRNYFSSNTSKEGDTCNAQESEAIFSSTSCYDETNIFI